MKKLYKLEQLEELKSKYTKEVLQSIEETITVLNENYGGESRNVDEDLGGYVILIDNEEEVNSIKSDILKTILPEYTDEIKGDDGTKYYSSLFLLSSDYAVTIYYNKELHELLLGKAL
ncbi:hypothetical protein GND98_016025 [Clostridium butyricum]|uniref:Uncharacterized protein n=1 Tax=Clostridium butyricum TaxID=1492 RepID=A0A6L9ERZ3_CLOBU|nr:hypothetical protein [Clostridium butyricum]NAS19322.1 hypothetical protein [Clostridium butyricum]RQN09163.1 hypothetical protein EHW71_12985 [Clostridium butyricum]